MNAAATSPLPSQPSVQRPAAPPRDADGDHDGTTAAAVAAKAIARQAPVVVSKGHVDGYV